MVGKNRFGMRRIFVAAAAALGTVSMVSSQAVAHENHAPLPTKGVTIAGDTIMLSDRAREAIGLATAKIEFRDLHRVLTVNARVELPWHAQAMVTSMVPGKIDRVLIRPGETVAPGQELARVVSNELETLQLDLQQAKVQVDLARKLVEQQSALDRQGVIAGKTLFESESTLAKASAALQIVRQKLMAIGLDTETLQRVEQQREVLAYVPIISPVGGIITHADVRVGQMVSPAEHLYHVIDPSTLWIIGEVLESDVRLLAERQPIEADFAALPGEVFRGEIHHLRLTMDPQTRTQAVVIAIDNSDQKLRPGMSGRVRISVEVAQQAIVCPVDAVIRSRTGNYLLVQRVPGKYESRKVRLGLTEMGRIEVLEGVFPGDQVVVAGNALLAALLGNEHKARVGGPESESEPDPETHQGIVVAHGFIELPTDQQALATPQIEGRVRRILVQPSQHVAQGDVLVEIDSLPLRSVQLDLLQTLTQERFVEQSLKRLEELHDQGIVAKRQRWELQSDRQMLGMKSQVLQRQLDHFGLPPEAIEKLKQADLSQAGSLAELVPSLPVRAPAAGCIVGFHVVPGQVVHPGETLFEIHDLSTVWIKGFVYERDANRVQLGQPANVHFTAYPDLEVNGKVVRISPRMHERMRVLPVWVEAANPDHLLKSGMLARMTIMDTSARDAESGDVARLQSIKPNR